MARFWIIGAIVAVAFTVYSIADAAIADKTRVRGIAKGAWIVAIIFLPILGGVLWFLVGRPRAAETPRSGVLAQAPDDLIDGSRPGMSKQEINDRVSELEKRLQELDDEVFPGEDLGHKPPRTGRNTGGADDSSDTGPETGPDRDPELDPDSKA